MKLFDWKAILVTSLLALFVLSYAVHYAFFRDADYIFKLLIEQVGSASILAPLIMVVMNQVFTNREKRNMLRKLNMVIGAFFSQIGTPLLKSLSEFDLYADRIARDFIVSAGCSEKDFAALSQRIKHNDYATESQKSDLGGLQALLVGNRDFLLRLLENPNLLEHDSFTELLWAVFHLADELAHRPDVAKLPDSDYAHLSGDIKRAYVLLISEWLAYMNHLRQAYPYLFSLAIRTNPFDPTASVEVR